MTLCQNVISDATITECDNASVPLEEIFNVAVLDITEIFNVAVLDITEIFNVAVLDITERFISNHEWGPLPCAASRAKEINTSVGRARDERGAPLTSNMLT